MVIQLHEYQLAELRSCFTFFTLFFLFTEDLDDEGGVYISNRTDGSLRRLQAHTKTKKKLTRELLFATAAAFIAHT